MTAIHTVEAPVLTLPSEGLDVEQFRKDGILHIPGVFSSDYAASVLESLVDVIQVDPQQQLSEYALRNHGKLEVAHGSLGMKPQEAAHELVVDRIFRPLGLAIVQTAQLELLRLAEQLHESPLTYIVRNLPFREWSRPQPVHSDGGLALVYLQDEEGSLHRYELKKGKLQHVGEQPTRTGDVILLNQDMEFPNGGGRATRFHAGHNASLDQERWLVSADNRPVHFEVTNDLILPGDPRFSSAT